MARLNIVDGQASAAYRRGYATKKTSAKVNHEKASRLFAGGKVVTVDSLVKVIRTLFSTAWKTLMAVAKRMFWDSDNWQSLCDRCHKTIKPALEQAFAAGRLGGELLDLARPFPEMFGGGT